MHGMSIAHPMHYAIFHILHMPLLFTQSAYNNIAYGISPSLFSYEKEEALYHNLSQGRVVLAFRAIIEQPILLAILLANIFFMGAVLFAFLGPLWYWFLGAKVPRTFWFFLFVIIFHAFLSSPTAGARFRIPLNPFIFLLALDSLSQLKKLIQIRYA